MKLILEFEDTEKYDYECAIYGKNYRIALWDILSEIRRQLKYTDVSEEQFKILENIREFTLEQLENLPFDR